MEKFLELVSDHTIKKIYNDSKANSIPMLRPNTTLLLVETIKKYNIKNCLEIGTAFGFSAAVMAIKCNVDVVTIEKDSIRNMKAKTYLNNVKNVNCVLSDCFTFETDKKFDMLFLDGPKANQDKLLDKFISNLNEKGIIFIDNLFLKKFLDLPELSNNQLKILDALEKFRNYIENIKGFKCTIYDIEDGVAILERL